MTAVSAPFSIGQPAANQPPGIAIQPPAVPFAAGPVAVSYTLFDEESDPLSIAVSFSIDGGATFQPARQASNGSDGIANLSSSPTGTPHRFVWDAEPDLKGRPLTGVLLRIAASDAHPGGTDTVAFWASPPAGSVRFSLDRDRMNRITRCARAGPFFGDLRTWRYDSAGRIVAAASSPVTWRPGPGSAVSRLFDGDSVVCQETRHPAGQSPAVILQTREERGRVVTRGGVTLAYDPNGNLTADGAGSQFVYDAFHRLTSVLNGGQTIAAYQYDAWSRCIRKTSATLIENYYYDGWELIEIQAQTSAGNVVERWIYTDETDDALRVEIAGQSYNVLHAPEGWIYGLTDAQGSLIETYAYSLTGEVSVIAPDGTTKPAATRPLSRLLFQGHPFDFDVGLYRFRLRWYHAALGLFLTPDPHGFTHGANFYALCHCDPVNFADRHGLQDGPAGAGQNQNNGPDPNPAQSGNPPNKPVPSPTPAQPPSPTPTTSPPAAATPPEPSALGKAWDAMTDWRGWWNDLTNRGGYAFHQGVVSPTVDAFTIEFGGGLTKVTGKAIFGKAAARTLPKLFTAGVVGTGLGVADQGAKDLTAWHLSSRKDYLKSAAGGAIVFAGRELVVIVGGKVVGFLKKRAFDRELDKIVEEGIRLATPGSASEGILAMGDATSRRNLARRAFVLGEEAEIVVLGKDGVQSVSADGKTTLIESPAFKNFLEELRKRYPKELGLPRVRSIDNLCNTQLRGVGGNIPSMLDNFKFSGWTPMGNLGFIRGAIEGGVPVALATPLESALEGSFLKREIDWLLEAGYELRPATEALPHGSLVPPGLR